MWLAATALHSRHTPHTTLLALAVNFILLLFIPPSSTTKPRVALAVLAASPKKHAHHNNERFVCIVHHTAPILWRAPLHLVACCCCRLLVCWAIVAVLLHCVSHSFICQPLLLSSTSTQSDLMTQQTRSWVPLVCVTAHSVEQRATRGWRAHSRATPLVSTCHFFLSSTSNNKSTMKHNNTMLACLSNCASFAFMPHGLPLSARTADMPGSWFVLKSFLLLVHNTVCSWCCFHVMSTPQNIRPNTAQPATVSTV